MKDEEVRHKILEALYQVYRESPRTGSRPKLELGEELGINKQSLDFNVGYLVDSGLIKYLSYGGRLTITADGLRYFERKSEISSPEDHIRQSIQISGGEIGQIFQAKEITIKPEIFVKQMAELAEKHPALSGSEKKSWVGFLKHPLLIEIVRQTLEIFKG